MAGGQHTAQQHFSLFIKHKLAAQNTPQAISLFLKGIWTDCLTYYLLREGEDSISLTNGIKFVDELLWSASPESLSENEESYKQRLRFIGETLSTGMQNLGYGQAAILSELEKLLYSQLKIRQQEPKNTAQENNRSTKISEAAEAVTNVSPASVYEVQIEENKSTDVEISATSSTSLEKVNSEEANPTPIETKSSKPTAIMRQLARQKSQSETH